MKGRRPILGRPEGDRRSQECRPDAGTGTLVAQLLRHAAERPDAVALRHKRLGRWEQTTWSQYARRSAQVGMGLQSLGVRPGDRVAVHSENRPEWLLADLGAQGIGAITVGIYPTSPSAEVEYLLAHSECAVLIAEDEEQLDKTLAVRERLPALRHILVIDPKGVRDLGSDPMLMTFAELEQRGIQQDAERWRASVAALAPSDTAIIVYTSGTTGPPKGALLTHANLVAAGEAWASVYEARPSDEVLSYLPLCHVAERLFSGVFALRAGYVVNFGEGPETFSADLREVQPTLFLGVPRVWEKMLAGVEIRVADADPLKRAAYRTCVRRGRAIARRQLSHRQRRADRLERALLSALCFRTLRDKLGMSRIRVALSGAAPIAPEVLEWLRAIGVSVREGYGMTENTAVATYTPADDVRLGSVGRALPGVELLVAPDGEILTRSATVFAGYFKNPEATAAAVDRDGWLHTGDIGEVDADGFLRITDRKKDLIITAGGKNISPSEIENKLKVSPYVREAIVIGDRRRYLTALIGIEGDVVGDWATRNGVPFTTYADLSARPQVRELIGDLVDMVNAQFAQAETIKRFELIPIELDHEDGHLTATQKVKRAAISEQFSELIDGMYR